MSRIEQAAAAIDAARTMLAGLDGLSLAPDAEVVVDPAALHHKNPITPYAGRTLTGAVRSTLLRGIPIDVDAPPRGRQLVRGE